MRLLEPPLLIRESTLFARPKIPDHYTGVTLLYAHWEGFIRDAARAYLQFVACRPQVLIRLTDSFLAVALAGEIRTAGQSRKISAYADLIRTIRAVGGALPAERRLPWKRVISTRSNLKSARLKEIVITLGLNYSKFELKEKSVVDRLAAFRNSIAHGHGRPVDQADFQLLHSETILLMDTFRDLIEVAAYSNAHLR